MRTCPGWPASEAGSARVPWSSDPPATAPAARSRLAGENFPARLRASAHVLRHVHLSEPDLAPVGAGGSLDLPAISAALRDIGYAGWVSVEMKPGGLEAVRTAAGVASSLR